MTEKAGRIVSADEFLQTVTPGAQRSRLAPFWNDITKLRESGCTLAQVCEFLAVNGVPISKAGLSKYIKRRQEKQGPGARTPSAPADEPPEASQIAQDRARRERKARQFIGDKPENPLLKAIKEKRK